MIRELCEKVDGVRFADQRLLSLTPEAREKTLKLIGADKGANFLRVSIAGGGCNGLSYKMSLVEQPKAGDLVVESDGVFVVVDSKSALYLKGTTLTYSKSMIGGGYKFVNPNATSSCSCGESFSI